MKLYTSKVVAQWIGVTERRVRQLRDDGIIQEAKPGLYDLQQTVLKYIKYLGGAGKENLNTERTKLTAEKRKAAEMENQLRQGSLLEVTVVEAALKNMLLNFRSRLLSLPAKLSPKLATMGGKQADIFDELERELKETLEVFSGYRAEIGLDGKATREDEHGYEKRDSGHDIEVRGDPETATGNDTEPVGGSIPDVKPGSERGTGALEDG